MEFADSLPKQIGNVKLNYDFYPGEDIYSDGEIEDELLAITKNAARLEYPSIIEEKNNWPVLYHLSPLRGNIVDWLPVTKDMKVLEIGSGCGAITDKLSEKAGHVTCVDLSAKRSLINAYRNQDRDNIEIFVGNFSDIEPVLPTDYDLVCLIGVFEYGNSYIHTETPYEDFFKIMQKHRKDTGHLVIAIENKFGLKYWAGCKEDHVGTFFSGLEGYPENDGSARTFTRRGLEKIFEQCGEKNYHFYYPYPDYKFPTTVYSDQRKPFQGELTDNMRNFDRDRMVVFREKYVFDSAVADDYFDVFANSYMVVIGEQPQTIYVKYSNDRAPQYELRTEIVADGRERKVRKYPMSEASVAHVRQLSKCYEQLCRRYEGCGLKINPCVYRAEGYVEFPYEKGVTLEALMDRCLEQHDAEGFKALFARYWELISYRNPEFKGQVADYDLIFANILVDGENWTLIDYEWTLEEEIEDKEIAFRAVYCYLLEDEKRNEIDLDYVMQMIGVSQVEAEEYRKKEAVFQKRVTGKRKSMGELRAGIGTYAVDPKKLMEEHLQEILDKRIQLYYDRGHGFCEQDSCYIPDVYIEERLVETTLFIDGNVRNFRVDPADRPCIVKLQELVLNGVKLPYDKKLVETNGKQIKPGTYVFATPDPNVVLHMEEIVAAGIRMEADNRLDIRMEISPVSLEAAEEITSMIKKIF